ncbi:MAG: hypothetical protein N2645_15160 [Clostridia bacterium]|nr:hypothetical protein [Clostridia bacterium]
MQKISRQKTVEGTKVPGIIRNIQYFYINVDVYEDGMVNCWELVDLDGLEEKLRTSWLLPQVPEGENISIHGLGCYKIQSAVWKYNNRTYYKYIKGIIKKLNPKLTNIYKISKEEKALLEKRRIKYSPQATELYTKNDLFYQTVEGKGFTIFINKESKNYLVNLVVYKDGKVNCYNSEFEITYSLEGIKELFHNGTFFTNFSSSTGIVLDGLGEVVLSDILYSADISEKYKELVDNYEKLNGNETSLEKCREAYHEYLEYPSEEGRTRLKELYELVPKHERMYLGDMDSRDTDYVRIIYRPDEKRDV